MSQIQSFNDSGSYEIVGDIAIIRLLKRAEDRIDLARQIMNVHHNVRTVMAQSGKVCGKYRLRNLEHVTGERKTVTTHRESGCAFRVDVSTCYFSPRLFHERARIASLIKQREVVLNMFSGVGTFSIVAAKHSPANRVYSIDLNPQAYSFMRDNIRLNGVFSRVIPLLGDAKQVIKERFIGNIDRVLMPLPDKALAYLPYALSALKSRGGTVHYYVFEHARQGEDPMEKTKIKIRSKLEDLKAISYVENGRILRSTGPHWYLLVLDICLESRFDNS